MILKIIGPLFDRLLGVRKLRMIYERHDLQGLGKYEFIEKFQKVLKLHYHIDATQLGFIPKTGPVVIVANHPLGGLEGILLALALREARPDYKIFVNIMLYFIKELEDFFIFTNPMAPGSRDNIRSVGLCRAWLKAEHCLVVFPAGRVGLYREAKGYITDESWDHIALSMGLMSSAPFVPIFVGGQCGKFFSWMCRLIFPMKLLLLVREFIRSFGTNIEFTVGRPISNGRIASMKRKQANAYLRMRTYLLKPADSINGACASMPPILQAPADSPEPGAVAKCIDLLPQGQILFVDDNFLVGWCDRKGSPEIADRLIELRRFSGLPGADSYDDTCRHLFVLDRRHTIISAACRLGKVDTSGSHDFFLRTLFDFPSMQKTATAPSTELSFLFSRGERGEAVESLLWDGIKKSCGGKKLLGTVFINAFLPEAVYGINALTLAAEALSRKNLLPPGKKKPSQKARFAHAPKTEFPFRLHREVEEYLDRYSLNLVELEEILAALDGNAGKLPFLTKQLLEEKAEFVSVGMDAASGLPILLFTAKIGS